MLPPTLLPTAESGTFLDGLDAGYTPDSAGDSANPLDSAFARS